MAAQLAQTGKPGEHFNSSIAESVAVQMLEGFLPQSRKIGDIQLLLFRQQLRGLESLNLIRQLFKHIAFQAA
ncbi:hypothetical protein D3C86_2098560 [compost metagenome]